MLGTTFDDLKNKDLPNWGAFSRRYLPPLREAMNPIYGLIKRDENEGHGDILELLQMVQAGKLPLSLIAHLRPGQHSDEAEIREDDALELDSHMERMMRQAAKSRHVKRNYRILKNEFYRQEVNKRGRKRIVEREDVDAAIRALQDLIFGENKSFA
jgi:hypothetical protein